VIFARRREAPGPIPVRERWRQVFESGEVALHPFSQAELDAVTLEPESARPDAGLPYLQRLSPLLGQAPLAGETSPDPWSGQDGGPAADAAAKTADISALASAAVRLEAAGYVRPGPTVPPEGQIPIEFAGLAAAADGTLRRVALAGDLGLITYMQTRPLFVAEVHFAPDPVRPEFAPTTWQLVARGYVPYEMPGCLIELPQAPDAGQPPRAILREDRAAVAMLGWLGGDVAAYLELREARTTSEQSQGESAVTDQPPPGVPTATVAGGFSRLAQLTLILPAGEQVLLRALAVASGADGHWLLVGQQLEVATHITLGQLGDRLDEMLAAASRPGAASPPSGPAGA
jgi:hypothetical protein